MKIDRSVKFMLALIAVLLALSCAKDLTLTSNSSVEAAPPPSFLQVGTSYNFNQGNMSTDVEVVEIQDTGWIKGKNNLGNMVWINPNACYQIRPNR
jgi:hypothetical protein